MRVLPFLLASFFAPMILAAEVTTVGIYGSGKSIDIEDPAVSQCSVTEVEKTTSVNNTILDCTKSTLGALKGGTYLLNKKATRKNQGDPVYTCIRGCGKGVVRTIKYITLESGC